MRAIDRSTRRVPSSLAAAALGGLLVLALAGCGAAATPGPAASVASVTPSPAASVAAASATPTATPTHTYPLVVRASPSVFISIDGPSEVAAGKEFSVAWQGPVTLGDYIVIVPKGTTAYTGEGSYANTTTGNPVKLKAPTTPGDYELWYLLGDTNDAIRPRRPITVK